MTLHLPRQYSEGGAIGVSPTVRHWLHLLMPVFGWSGHWAGKYQDLDLGPHVRCRYRGRKNSGPNIRRPRFLREFFYQRLHDFGQRSPLLWS